MDTIFQLPALCAAIPVEFKPDAGEDRAVALARCLLDAGVIHGAVSARRASDPLGTSRLFLERWVAERLQGLHCLFPAFRLVMEGASEMCNHTRPREPGQATIVWYTECSAFAVGEALDRLEQIHPRLGATVLTVIDRLGPRLIPTFTPTDVMGTAQEYYWYGEQDESAALDEQCGEDPAEREAMREEMVTREKIDAAFPAWATQWPGQRKRLSRAALQRIAKGARSCRVRQLMSDVLALEKLNLNDEFRPNGDGWFVGYGAVLTWKPDDIAVRVFDDFANDAVQGDFVDWMGEAEFSIGEPETLRHWMEGMEVRLKGMRLLDNLIHELSSGDWHRVPKGMR
jgi:PRTRC genetic system protein F